MDKSGAGRPIDPNKDRAILRAGRALLFGQGPQAVTMEAVARAAGVAKPTLYRRFANRDDLLAAIAQAEAEAMSARFELIPGKPADLQRSLRDFAVDLSRFLLGAEHIRFIHALGSTELAQSAREAIFRNGPLRTRERFTDWLARAAQAGIIRCPQPADSAERFLGMLMGLDLVRMLYHVHPPREPESVERHAEAVVEDFLRLHRIG